ncbi:hypothetical protein [Clostridium frigidicarnis]|nr:hypothetical protein [Clostridium frigidicarnis]
MVRPISKCKGLNYWGDGMKRLVCIKNLSENTKIEVDEKTGGIK